MSVGEDVIVWILTILMFFFAVMGMLVGSNIIKLKVSLLYEDVIDAQYATSLMFDFENSFSKALGESYDCRNYVLHGYGVYISKNGEIRESQPYRKSLPQEMYMPHSTKISDNPRITVVDEPGDEWERRKPLDLGRTLLIGKDRYFVLSPYIARYSWDGLCKTLLSSYTGREKVHDCNRDRCSMIFFVDSVQRCATYDKGVVCSTSSISIPFRIIDLNRGDSLYAVSDGKNIRFEVNR